MTFENIMITSHQLFGIILPIITLLNPVAKTGRPRSDLEKVFLTIMTKAKTGDPWHHFDYHQDYVSGSTANAWHIKWAKMGLYDIIFFVIASLYHKTIGYKLEWQSVDTTKCQAPVHGEKLNTEGRGRNPTDRGFSGTKISLHVDEDGAVLGLVVTGANVHDSKILEETIADAQKNILACTGGKLPEMNLCLDKGYYGQPCEVLSFINGFISHIRSRGEEKEEKQEGFKPRRWVVERTFGNLKTFHGIRTRYTRKLKNFTGLVRLACSTFLFKRIINLFDFIDIKNIMNNEFVQNCIARYRSVGPFLESLNSKLC